MTKIFLFSSSAYPAMYSVLRAKIMAVDVSLVQLVLCWQTAAASDHVPMVLSTLHLFACPVVVIV